MYNAHIIQCIYINCINTVFYIYEWSSKQKHLWNQLKIIKYNHLQVFKGSNIQVYELIFYTLNFLPDNEV